jgi:hypothetical protein
MIQKIRSYLLDDEENKSSVGLYVVIVLLAPMLGIFFEYRKTKSPYLATVNGVPISKSIFRLKLFEQTKILESFQQYLGKEKGEELYKYAMGGADIQSVVIRQQLFHALFSGMFQNFISESAIVSTYISQKIKKNDAKEFFINHFGLLPYELVTSKNKNSIAQSIGFFDMNLLDQYCQDAIAGDTLKKIISAPILAIEKNISLDFERVPKKIDFITFSIKKDKNLIYNKKISTENSVKENEILSVYQEGILSNLFINPREIKADVYVYTEKTATQGSKKNKKEEKSVVTISEETVKKIVEDEKSKEMPLKNIFEIDFARKAYHSQVNFSFSDLENSSSSVNLPVEVRRKYIEFVMTNTDNIKDFYFVHEKNIYCFVAASLSPLSHKSLKESKDAIISIIKNKRVLDAMYKDSDLVRYALEAGETPSVEGWAKGNYSLLVASVENESQLDVISRTILKKVYRSGIKLKSSFLIETETDIIIYFCADISYSDTPYVRRGREREISPLDPYSNYLENKAKIVVNKDYLSNSQ